MEIARHEVGPRFSEMTAVHLGTAKLLYLSGQVAENTSLDITGQTREILMFIERLLEKEGGDKTSIVSVRIFLASVGDDWVVPGHTPSRTTIGAKLIRPEYKIEIEVQAAIKM